MIKNNINIFLFYIISVLFCNVNLFAKNINIDGINDWAVITDTFNALLDNSSIVIDNDEWVWKDKIGDARTNLNYTHDMSNSIDLCEFRVTASTTSLFFFIRFKELNASSEGYMYPHIQIAIGIEKNSDKRQFLVGNYLNTNNPDIVTVSENAGWSSLLEIFQTEKTTDSISSNNYIWRINSSGISGNSISYNQSFTTKMARALSKSTTSNFIETEINYISMGISDFYSDICNKSLMFSVVVNYAALPFNINISTGYVKEFDNDSSNIVDCISITSGTVNGIKDDILNHYFEIKLDNNAKIIPDTSLPYFQDNKIYIDNKSENKDVYYSALTQPIITWEYKDDNNELQTGLRIQIGDDNIWTDTDGFDNGPAEIWDYSLSCSTDITSSLSQLFNPVRYSGKELLPDVTYYIRAQLINTRGYSSNWLYSFFHTTKSAINLSLGKDDMYIDWNNPFYPEDPDFDKRYTKIRYVIAVDKNVELSIYNIMGERIKTLDYGDKNAKVVYTVNWDGKTDTGDMVGSGVYLVNLRTISQDKNTSGITKKIFVIK